jgi:lipopolysaccharide transport system ATP-binding protein
MNDSTTQQLNEVAISVKNLSKSYKMYPSSKERLKEMLHPFGKKYHQDFWALRDVSFEVKKGETVGIIGQNGSGKSTLLQILCGIMQPTTGDVKMNGRVSALLELGAGFNPQFTGRENVYLSGALMGFTKKEMDEKFQTIVEFADIGAFIEQPVRTYSSGMFVRLAFACAVNVDPDILVIDEALAVGDMFFQAKCLLRLREMFEHGVTVLFVTHDLNTLLSLCKKGLLLDHGKLQIAGDAQSVYQEYFKLIHMEQNEILKGNTDSGENTGRNNGTQADSTMPSSAFLDDDENIKRRVLERMGDDPGWIRNVVIIDSEGHRTNSINFKEDIIIRIYIKAKSALDNYSIGYRICDDKMISIAHSNDIVEKKNLPTLKSQVRYILEFKVKNIFAPGNYSVMTGLEKVVIPNRNHVSIDGIIGAEVFRINGPKSEKDLFASKVHSLTEINIYEITE